MVSLDSHKKHLIGFAYLVLIVCISAGFLYRTVSEAYSGTLFFKPTAGGYAFIDYVAFYTAGKVVLSQARSAIYDTAVQLDWYNKTMSQFNIVVKEVPLAESVPWFFLLMVPFSFLPLLFSYFCWNLVAFSGSLAGLFLVLRQAQHDLRFCTLFLIGFAGCWQTQHLIHDGQNSWFVLIPLCFFLYGWLANKDTISGIGLACMSIKPQYALFMAIPPLVLGRWRTLASAAATGIALVAVSSAVYGLQTVLTYPQVLHKTEFINKAVFPTWMISVRGPLSILLPFETALNISMLFYAAGLIAVLLMWLQVRRNPIQAKVNAALAVTMIVCILTSPHTHMYDFVVFAAVAAITMPSLGLFPPESLGIYPKIWCLTFTLFPLLGFLVYIAGSFAPNGGEVVGLSFFVLNCWILFLAVRLLQTASESQSGTDLKK